MCTPAFPAASMSRVFFGTSTVTSSIVTFTCGGASVMPIPRARSSFVSCQNRVLHGTASVDMREEVLGKFLQRALWRCGGEVAERAEGLAADLLAHGLEQGDVARATAALRETCEEHVLPHRPLPAGDALATRLVAEEAREPFKRLDDADAVVEDHDPAGAELGADLSQRV